MTTTLADASAIRRYAEARGLGFLGFWSAGRDNGGCPGAPEARSDCSGVEQAPGAYTETLGGFRA
jgi:chitinase